MVNWLTARKIIFLRFRKVKKPDLIVNSFPVLPLIFNTNPVYQHFVKKSTTDPKYSLSASSASGAISGL